MMVETMLESSQDFGMSSGMLPQWKRELLQRRASRPRPPPPAAAAAPPPPPPPPAEDDEELRYGPGIVKRLKSRYLSLALREQPRRRPSVLRRAASLEQLDEPPQRPRPASLAAPPKTLDARRESVKRARSVDALARLESREDAPPAASAPAPPVSNGTSNATNVRAGRPPRRPQPLLRETERPPADVVRTTLRKFEPRRAAGGAAARVAAVLRGLEARSSTPEPRAREPSPPAADLSAIEEPPASPASPATPAAGASPSTRHVSRAALDGIAKAGSTVRYSFGNKRTGDHLPPVQTANPVLIARHQGSRRVGVIRPMPPHEPEEPIRPVSPAVKEDVPKPVLEAAPPACSPPASPPAVLVEPTPRSPAADLPVLRLWERRIADSPERTNTTENEKPLKKLDIVKPEISRKPDFLTNGHREVTPERNGDVTDRKTPYKVEETVTSLVNGKDHITCPKIGRMTSPTAVTSPKAERLLSPKIESVASCFERVASPKFDTIGSPKSERVVSPRFESVVGATPERVSSPKVDSVVSPKAERVTRANCDSVSSPKPERVIGKSEPTSAAAAVLPSGVRRVRSAAAAAAPAANSVVFNFADRKEVPDYIENDGIVLRASRRDKIKAGDPGVVVLRPEALAQASSDEDEPPEDPDRAPSPCAVKFVNDNVLINGKSSMPTRPNKDRISKLKLQFDDSLTRTFEYPSETSLCEEDSPAGAGAAPTPFSTPAPHAAPQHAGAAFAPLTDNTHMSLAAALSSYWPAAARAGSFELGVTPAPPPPAADAATHAEPAAADDDDEGSWAGAAAAAASWSHARSLHADLLF